MTREDQDFRKYEPSKIDLNDKESTHVAIVDFTGSNKKVLEIGTATGYISRILTEKGNQVTGVEKDEKAASIARESCDRLIVGDIETLKLDSLFEPAFFDVIIFGDVLEHLNQPAEALKKVKPYLKPGGYLVVSLPNIAHGDIILNLMQGRFGYTSTGLLDQTHLRFFALADAIKLFDDCGYLITELHVTPADVGTTELKVDLSLFPSQLVGLIESLPYATAYQFVFKAFLKEGERTAKILLPSVSALAEVFEKAKDKRIAQLETEIAGLKMAVTERDNTINDIQASKGWNLLQKGYRIRDKLLSRGSRRRAVFDKLFGTVRQRSA